MYDSAGSWNYDIGLPAKSGVAGGVVAVLPGRFGMAVFSPRLDAHGNSMRGIAACRRLADDLALHPLRAHPITTNVVRGSYRGDHIRSTRVRREAEERELDRLGTRVVVHELQGNLHFTSVEALTRAVLDDLDGVAMVVLEGRRLGSVDTAARSLLVALAANLVAAERTLLFAEFPPGCTPPDSGAVFAAVDDALEWCEDELLGRNPAAAGGHAATLGDQELLRGLDEIELAAVEAAVTRCDLPGDSLMLREGDPADAVYFVLAGKVSVWLPSDRGAARRVAAFGPGVAVGDAALVDGATRSADVYADEPSQAAVLSLANLGRLRHEHPALIAKIYANLARILSDRLRRTNVQLRALRQ
jgi:glutaminase